MEFCTIPTARRSYAAGFGTNNNNFGRQDQRNFDDGYGDIGFAEYIPLPPPMEIKRVVNGKTLLVNRDIK